MALPRSFQYGSRSLRLRSLPFGSRGIFCYDLDGNLKWERDLGQMRTRRGWGADESTMTWTIRDDPLRAAVVHHTAGTNSYTAAQSASIVRGIYHYHAVSRGWGDIGYNVLTDEYVNMLEAGIIDPVKVTRSAVANAASIAGMILTTEALITDKPEKEAAMPSSPDMGGMY